MVGGEVVGLGLAAGVNVNQGLDCEWEGVHESSLTPFSSPGPDGDAAE